MMRTYSSKPEKSKSQPIPQQKSPDQAQSATPVPPTIQAKTNEEGLAEWKAQQEKWARLGTPWQDKVPNPSGELAQPWIQRKLTLGQPGDKYEQEADRVASQVVQQINDPTTKKNNLRQSIQRKKDLEGEMQARCFRAAIQRKQAIAGGEASPDLETAINSARGGGQPLDAELRQSMGQVMGADFSKVRVHTDTQSDQLNQSIQANAFTTGQDVFFRKGTYQPGNRGGQELIAHELTHVMQQNSSVQRYSSVRTSGNGIIQRQIGRESAMALVQDYQTWLGGAVNEESLPTVKRVAQEKAIEKFKKLEKKYSKDEDPITLEQFKNMLEAAPPRKGKKTAVSSEMEKAWVDTLTELNTGSLQPGDVAIRKDLEHSTTPVMGQKFLKGGMGSKWSGHAALYIGNSTFAEATGGEKVQRVGLSDISKHAKKEEGGYYDTVYVIYRPNNDEQAKAAVGIARWITLADLGYSKKHCAVPGPRSSKYGKRSQNYVSRLSKMQATALLQGELMDALNANDYEWMCQNIDAFEDCGIKGLQVQDIANLATDEGVALSPPYATESLESDSQKATVTKQVLLTAKKTLLSEIRRVVVATVNETEMMCSEFVTTCFQSMGDETLIKKDAIAMSPVALENYLIGNPDKFTVQGAYTVPGAQE